MGEWPEVSLSALVDVAVGGLWGSEFPTDKENMPVRVIRGVDAHKMSQREPVELPVRWANSKQLKGRTLSVGDVVLEASGACGRSYVIRESDITNNAIPMSFSNFSRRLVPNAKVNPAYLGYRLKQAYESNEIASYVTGTAMPNLDVRSALAGIPINLPPLPEQREIASILGALDDKIELNRRMNATIEAMARALFQSWFVDFDPVRAKAEGRQPVGMDAETAALFPDSFEESALGPIPKGWAPTSVNEIFNTRNTRVEPDEHKDHLRYVALDDMRSKSIGIDSFRAGSEVNSSIIEFTTGDVLFGAMRPYFHKVGLAPFSGITRTTTFVLVPKDEWLRYYGLFALSTDVAIEYATSASIGTTIPYVTWDALGKYKCTLAPPEILKAFSNSVGDLLARMTLNIASVAALTGARDTLLPKLLSGELRVGDVAA